MSTYETVIGIETHVQLATKSKLFCGCNNDSREAEPNTHVCPVCLGFPGALPVLNEAAVRLALRGGVALHAYDKVRRLHTKFDRKNYFYPDSPMNYQITQYDEPIIGRGWVEFPLDGATKRVGVTRAHLEADAGKLIHPPGADYSLVDLNRAGTPLLEIVSEPDMCSAAEAKAYAQELYHLMRYADVSDADLYYGNMRFDVNVSLRPAGAKKFGTRTESKNLNSFRAVAGVVDYETKRQAELLAAGKPVTQETRGWDEAKGVTFSQRTKEEAHDYRYFPEPDLPPLEITDKMLGEAKKERAITPSFVRSQLAFIGVKPEDVDTVLFNLDIAMDYMETILLQKDATQAQLTRILNWMIHDSPQGESGSIGAYKPREAVALARAVEAGRISATAAKRVWSELLDTSHITVEEIIQNLSLEQVSDSSELERIVEEVIAANPEPVKQYQAGEAKVLGFLVGQVMKASRGQANPPMVNAILKKKLGGAKA